MKAREFNEEEVPYEVLTEFGLTREMIEDLPTEVLDDIFAGKPTPVLPIRVRADEEHHFESKSRFELKHGVDGVKVMFYPVLERAPITQFTDDQQSQLKDGKTIMVEIVRNDEEVMSFVQLDADTNQVMSVPSPVIGRNLQVLSDELNLSGPEVNVIKNGEPLTILVDDESVTIGIDLLHADTGIRIENGDAQQWKNATKREWDKYTFGMYGCWVADENGDLSYVAEDDYSEELWSELRKKAGMQNSPKR